MTERRALVVEDSFLILMALEMLLEMNDVTIVGPASTVAEALALAQTGGFDIAILDINLQDELVFPVADVLLARGTPMIFTTGYVPEAMLPERFKHMPAIQKPYETDALMALVEQAFALASAKQEAST
jgi:DNA-binding NtrC family response regulator